jgi:ABC-2 type transport system permease protein
MSILFPIIYLVILGNSFQGKLKSLPFAVANLDSGPYSQELMRKLRAIQAGPATMTIHAIQDQGEVMDGIREGRYKGGLIIPPDFSRRIVLKKRPEIGLFLDNTDGISSEAIRAAIIGAQSSMNLDYVAIREKADQIYLREVSLYKQVDYSQSLVPGVVIMAIFLGTMTTGAFNLVMDRFLGIEESYLLTPLSKSDIVGGLILSGLFITTIIAFLILIVSVIITGISLTRVFSQFASIATIIIITTLSLLSLMFLILGRFDHPRIVGVLSGFLNVILFFPSGAIYPIDSFPGWLKTFAKINPEAYAVHALKSVLFKGASLKTILPDITFLSVFTIIMLLAAIATFKRRV